MNRDIDILTVIINRNCQRNLCLTVVYIPPNSRIENALTELSNVADYILTLDCDWIIGGDFNIDAMNPSNSKTKKLMNNFVGKYSLKQLVKSVTRKTSTSATLIDHIYIS